MVFYYANMIAPKGPLGVVWIASTLDRQLKRNQILEANITSSVDQILATEFPQLRMSSQLLLGVVRIYSRKVGYLYQECNDALSSIREVAQRPTPGKNDKNPARATAAPSILPDDFELEDIATTMTQPTTNIPDMDLQMGPSTSMAPGRQTEVLFGSNYMSAFDDQFDMEGNAQYDLPVEEFHLMREEGLGGAANATQPGNADAEELCEFHIDLGFRFEDTEVQAAATETAEAAPAAAERSVHAEEATAHDHGAPLSHATGDGHVSAEGQDGATSAHELEQNVAGHDALPDAAVTESQVGTQNEDATQPEDATQAEPATQTEDGLHAEAGTQEGLSTQDTEDTRKPRRSSRKNAAVRDTPMPTRELRQRRSAAADSDVGSQAEGGSQAEAGSSQQSASSKGSQRARIDFLTKRKCVVDVDEKTQQPLLILPGALQRKLLEDRSAIMTERGKRQKMSDPSTSQPDNSLLSKHTGPLYKPAISAHMSTGLQQMYCIGLEILDVRELTRPHDANKKDKKSSQRADEEEPAPSEQHNQPASTAEPTDTAEPTNTDVNINEHSSHEQNPPTTPASAPTPSHQSHQDHYHEDPGVGPTPEVGRVDEREHEDAPHDMEATPSAAAHTGDDVEALPNADQTTQPQEQEDRPRENGHPTPSRRHREPLVYEDLGEPLPPHVNTDLTAGGVEDDVEAASDTVTAKSFTRRTRVVVAAIKAAVDHVDKSKRQKTNSSEAQAVPSTLHLSSFVKGHNRLHASRWFFELLVLKAKGVVELEQSNPYADIGIQAMPKLAEVTTS